MSISDLPIFAMLRTRMHWHQERQRILSENVANSDTPNFRARDLAPLTFDRGVKPPPGLGLMRTAASHLTGSEAGANGFPVDRKAAFEIRPTGNSVGLEEQMMKVASNQMDYQAATALYSRSLGLLKTALGKR